jgi:hypothetical protein
VRLCVRRGAAGRWRAPSWQPPRNRPEQRESPAKTMDEAELFSGGCYDGAFSEVLSLNHSAVPLDPPATHQSKLAPSVADQATKEQK